MVRYATEAEGADGAELGAWTPKRLPRIKAQVLLEPRTFSCGVGLPLATAPEEDSSRKWLGTRFRPDETRW
ncbi:hypothetical protein NDU88_001900 [Pleurodeles waltl]|uniref:Uncharacterized protein n=1 Tax=Pleurodeles waltl TaxID=8319 RepID=A0AAV7VCB0_PLEWA|nr:hypothetical protein NDU88_001900 [Pleurodeles waltl]